MNPARQILKSTAPAAFLLAVFLTAGSALAVDQPPQEPEQMRAWLVGHVIADMEALGTFGGKAFAKVPGIVDRLTDDQVALMAQYYYLTRAKTEQDAYLYSLQQQGPSPMPFAASRESRPHPGPLPEGEGTTDSTGRATFQGVSARRRRPRLRGHPERWHGMTTAWPK
jgi:hypothetical protein